MGLEDDLTAKAGPLPVWGWGVLVGGAAVAYVWFTRGTASNDPATAAASSDYTSVPLDTTLGVDDNSLAYSGNNANDVVDSPVATPQTGVPASNIGWITTGIAYMVNKGYNPLTVQNALSRYVSGKDVGVNEEDVIRQVVAYQGPPPKFGAGDTIHRKPIPTPEKPKPVRSLTQYVVSAGDTKASICRFYWGSATAMHMEDMRKINGWGANHHIKVGDNITVPLKAVTA